MTHEHLWPQTRNTIPLVVMVPREQNDKTSFWQTLFNPLSVPKRKVKNSFARFFSLFITSLIAQKGDALKAFPSSTTAHALRLHLFTSNPPLL